jgi:GcrA cell cycle regulator
MSWTNKSVEQLKTLWAEGQSASVIACRIGGITRNAVIGKVHRLGLPGRATRSRTQSQRQRTQALRVRSRNVQRPAITAPAKPRRVLTALPELAPAPPLIVTVATLSSLTCRWPIGDPFDAAFHFCGRAAAEHAPYCPHHMAIARR